MTHHEDPTLSPWLADGPNHGPSAGLEAALAKATSTQQRPAWLVNLTGGTISGRPAIAALYVVRSFAYVLVAALLVGLLVGTLVAGGVLRRPLPQQPVASLPAAVSNPTPVASAVPSVVSTATPVASVVPSETPVQSILPSEMPTTGLVAYTIGTSTAWLAASDGSSARALDGDYQALGWSADGSRLLLGGETHGVVVAAREGAGGIGLVLANAKGSPVTTVPASALCTFPCTMAVDFTLSPDGSHVAFVRGYDNDHGSSIIAILDLSTGDITELIATRATNPPDTVSCRRVKTCEGENGLPAWSPDGKQLVFERQGMSPEPGATWSNAALYVVDADGSNFRRVTPTGLYAHYPSWSPDGTRLVFSNTEFVVNAAHTRVLDMPEDIYTINIDGTGLTQLTQDGISALPNWTSDGRVIFALDVSPDPTAVHLGDAYGVFEHWIMDANGDNKNQIGDSLAELTAAGCTTCFYGAPGPSGPPPEAYWQPAP